MLFPLRWLAMTIFVRYRTAMRGMWTVLAPKVHWQARAVLDVCMHAPPPPPLLLRSLLPDAHHVHFHASCARISINLLINYQITDRNSGQTQERSE